MPVTARLSKKFYDHFGDEIAGEFVDWFNSVNSSNKSKLREMNEQDREWFRAELRAVELGLKAEFAQMEVKLGQKFTEMMKWMFVYWSGTMLTLAGLIMVLLRK